MKWVIRGIAVVGSLVVLLLVAALVLPFVVDFNQFKPHIKAAVGGAVNADLEFSSARLTILTGLGVELKDVKITHTDPTFKGIDFFKVKDLNFRVDLAPLLQQRLEGYVAIEGPEIIVATKGTQNNLASLPKPSDGEAAPPPTPDTPPESPEDKAAREAMIEQFKRNVVIRSFKIGNAAFTLRDYTGGEAKDKVKLEELNIEITNIGLEEDITTLISTKFAFNEQGLKVEGPIETKIVAQINTEGTNLKRASIDGKVDLDKLAINVQNAFVKKPGIPLNVAFAGNAGLNDVKLTALEFNFHTIKVNGNAAVDDFQKLATELVLGVESNDLKALGDVLPQHKDMLIGGRLKLDTAVNGLLSDLSKLKTKVNLDTKLTGADLRLNLDVQNAKAPVLATTIRSQVLDLDKLLGPFMPKDGTANEPTPTAATTPEADPNAPPAEDFALTEEQKALLKDANMRLDIALNKITYSGTAIDNFVILAQVQSLQATLEKFGLNIFDGSIMANGNLNLGANPIAFQGAFDMDSVQVQKLIELVAPEHKDVMVGKANFDLNLAGSGSTPKTLSKTLNGKGSFAFLEGTTNGGSIATELAEKLNGFIAESSVTKAADDIFAKAAQVLENPIVQKAPQAKNFNLDQKRQQYQSFSQIKVTDKMQADQSLKDTKGSLEIKDGRVYITSAKASDSGSLDLNSSVGLDMSLGGGATFTASETLKNHMTAQSKYASLMFDNQGQFALDLTLGGSAMAPTVNVNFDPIKQRFQANARALIEKEVQAEVDKLKNSLMQGKLDEAKRELAKKQAEAKAKLEAEKAKAKAKADAEKKKAQDAAKKKADEEKAKAKNKAKDKLKKKFGL